MKIYTSYFSNHKNFPPDAAYITIARGQPLGNFMPRLEELTPSWNIIDRYHEDWDEEAYKVEFWKQLDALDFDAVMRRLKTMSGGKDVVLVCWEGKDRFCHRHLVAEWFGQHGVEANEVC